MRGVVGAVIVPSLIACVACYELPAGDNPAKVIDTTGTEFEWSCDFQGCEVGIGPSTPLPPMCSADREAGYGYSAGHFVSIMSTCNNIWLGAWERPVACERRADCPQLDESSVDYHFECRNGLCQNVDVTTFPADSIDSFDAYLLCVASIPRSDTVDSNSTATMEVAARVDDACPTMGAPCNLPLPSPCLNP